MTRSSTTTATTTWGGRAATRWSRTTRTSPPRWSPARRSRARAPATRATTTACSSTPTTRCKPGNVVQQAHTRLTGGPDKRDLTLAISFAQVASQALAVAGDSLDDGFDQVAARYKQGWVDYRAHLFPIPATALPFASTYETSLLVLKAHEDKSNPGAFVASPSMPWGWGELKIDPDNPRSAPVPPRLGARPLPDRHGDAGGRRQDLGQPRAELPVRQAAARRRLVPAEHAGRREAQVDGRPDGPAGPADRARLPARPHQGQRLEARPQGRRLHRQRRPEDRPGALGEPGRVLAGDDRGRDRRPGLRGRHRAQERRDGQGREVRGARPTSGSATSSAGRRPATARTPSRPTTCA